MHQREARARRKRIRTVIIDILVVFFGLKDRLVRYGECLECSERMLVNGKAAAAAANLSTIVQLNGEGVRANVTDLAEQKAVFIITYPNRFVAIERGHVDGGQELQF